MMYMPDAIRATMELMETEKSKIQVRSSYNLSAMSFTPDDVYQSILTNIPNFKIDYAPDFRQQIAANWPESIDDAYARNDWGWKHRFDLDAMTADMLSHISVGNKSLHV